MGDRDRLERLIGIAGMLRLAGLRRTRILTTAVAGALKAARRGTFLRYLGMNTT
jgi:hypothetical protein